MTSKKKEEKHPQVLVHMFGRFEWASSYENIIKTLEDFRFSSRLYVGMYTRICLRAGIRFEVQLNTLSVDFLISRVATY